jgi:hypothetical protein
MREILADYRSEGRKIRVVGYTTDAHAGCLFSANVYVDGKRHDSLAGIWLDEPGAHFVKSKLLQMAEAQVSFEELEAFLYDFAKDEEEARERWVDENFDRL